MDEVGSSIDYLAFICDYGVSLVVKINSLFKSIGKALQKNVRKMLSLDLSNIIPTLHFFCHHIFFIKMMNNSVYL